MANQERSVDHFSKRSRSKEVAHNCTSTSVHRKKIHQQLHTHKVDRSHGEANDVQRLRERLNLSIARRPGIGDIVKLRETTQSNLKSDESAQSLERGIPIVKGQRSCHRRQSAICYERR